MRDALLAVHATLPDGVSSRFGSDAVKDVAGYDMKRLFIETPCAECFKALGAVDLGAGTFCIQGVFEHCRFSSPATQGCVSLIDVARPR